MESHNDSDEDSKKEENWANLYITLMRNLGMTMEQINNLSYPQFKALIMNMYDKNTFNIVMPYMGDGEKEGEKVELQTPEELSKAISSMNLDFK